MISITGVRHNWPTPPDFHLKRPNGHPDFTFVHFTTSVDLYLNGEKINTPEHACIIYKPGTSQDFHCPNGMLHDWFHFTNIPPNLLEELNLPTDLLIFPKQWSFITNLTEDIENEFYAKKEHSEQIIDLKVKELLIKLSRALKSNQYEIVDKKITSDLKGLRSLIKQNLSLDWTIEKMAKEVHLSPSRFAHLYQSFYGISPINDLILMRISTAQNALTFTADNVNEIAYSLGYKNLSHFCKQFRKIVGISPSQFRKK